MNWSSSTTTTTTTTTRVGRGARECGTPVVSAAASPRSVHRLRRGGESGRGRGLGLGLGPARASGERNDVAATTTTTTAAAADEGGVLARRWLGRSGARPREEEPSGVVGLGRFASRAMGEIASSIENALRGVADSPSSLGKAPLWAALAVLGLSLLLHGGGADPAHAAEVLGEASDSASASGGLFVPGLVGDDEFREGLTSGFLLILFSEIGDKTFFVAMLLAVRTSQASLNSSAGNGTSAPSASGGGGAGELAADERKLVVFGGTFAALSIMTVISCGIGRVFHSLDDFVPSGLSAVPVDDVAAVVLLTVFGVTSLRDARAMEEEEAQAAGILTSPTESSDEDAEGEKGEAIAFLKEMEEEGKIAANQEWGSLLLQTFLLVFAAEWGDRSFLSTIALSAAYPPLAVVSGATTGHAAATALAIGGGTLLAKYISEKTIAYIAGVLFLAFATATTIDIAAGNHLLL